MSDSNPTSSDQIGQLLLRLHYRELVRQGAAMPNILETEFRAYSQNGEDGILLYLFSLLGTTNCRVVEICAGNGIECNAANLIINHSWQGLLIDGDGDQVAAGREFYRTCRTTWVSPPTLVQAWITSENVDALVADNGFAGEIDLLSLDLDGNDYWIWKALACVRPRVIVLEFNGSAGPERSIAIAYDPQFRLDYSQTPYRCGASLAAFTKLGIAKGYRLVGVHSLGFNAFFVRDDLGTELLPTRSPVECYRDTPRLSSWTPGHLELLMSGAQAWEEI